MGLMDCLMPFRPFNSKLHVIPLEPLKHIPINQRGRTLFDGPQESAHPRVDTGFVLLLLVFILAGIPTVASCIISPTATNTAFA